MAKRIAQEMQNESSLDMSRQKDQLKPSASKKLRGASASGLNKPQGTWSRNHFTANDPS